ncbi:uncharacterized protein LY79DRAFT_592208 [Colletotrichum navitas]|uniref:Zn(2)-C6 fungal-type domain-containing protein n=1 Tax=Colletotrichum navitas TaxID=681940 RepID=A0AAD8PTG3_9PEZI|nr:uncharacterized protein LY79DRAFT_592208 [Colletotrichum navitas]KAK1580399.1 hypothetical protein LY79DRAFT_592208 [Colletotrichum navitas]
MSSTPSRRKSCASCRTSKSRCSLESPCRRCEERNLDCKYVHPPKRSAAYRALRPLPVLGDLNQQSSYVELLAHNGSTPAEASMNWDALVSPSFLHSSLGYELEHSELPSPSSTVHFNTPQNPRVIPEPSGLPWLGNRQQSDVLYNQRALLSLGDPEPFHTAKINKLLTQSESGQPRHSFYQMKPLAPRRNNGVASCFTVTVLLGQLLAYPKMMAKGCRLPPFIFPPCCMEGYHLTAGPCGKEFHKCLPETLAICCSLVQSFETRTAGSTSFVWKSIYKEVERIQCEYTSYDYKALLQALQALLVYLLLQAESQESFVRANSRS